uniref:Alpha-catulin n=1 Tax=Panagrellus redivivus TaxID=6233 RepID=A0A7E4VFM7_PANRE
MEHGGLPTSMNSVGNGFVFDPRNLEIKTASVEQTLVPLVTQISTLVNLKDNVVAGNRPKSDRALRSAMKIGTSLAAAVERFATVGETIADENPDIQPEMYDACSEARIAGNSISHLNNALIDDGNLGAVGVEKGHLVRASRQLLSSVTRVLLLADRVVVKNILRAEDKVAYSLTKLENTTNFTEFVKIFTEFGGEMVQLAHRSGERQQDLKSEKRKAQLTVARSNLERMTMLLLTASKTLLRHPDSKAARQCRDGVFQQIRLALQLIAICVGDGVMAIEANRYCSEIDPAMGPLDIGIQLTANVSIKQLMEMLEMVRMTSTINPSTRERLIAALGSLCEMTTDFTESSFTAVHHREQILDFLEECRFEMSNLISPEAAVNGGPNEDPSADSLEVTVERLTRRLKDLQRQLQLVAMDQIATVFRNNEDHQVLTSMKTCSVSGDIDGVEKYLEKFRHHAEHVQDVCRLLHHISMTDGLHVATGHAERNLRALAPLTLLSGQTLCIHPSSRIARENLEVFCDTWAQHINDLSKMTKELEGAASGRVAAEKQAYMSLPRPGKHGATTKPSKAITLDVEDQQKIEKVGLEMKMLTAEVLPEGSSLPESWDEYSENSIVKKAKAMSSMSYNMYLFTKGDGPLKTTHDLFTQAEFFAEQANKMYRTVREFAFEVPGSAEKNDMLSILDKIPFHCQQLQLLVKNPTVGKTATFNKVYSVISETKSLMNEIAKLVTACFVCATKFEIEFRGTSVSRTAINDEYPQRNSRESTLWRRTPSIRRTVPPQLHLSAGDNL